MIENRHLEKRQDDRKLLCFPRCENHEENKSVKMALDSIPNLEDLISNISPKITKIDGKLWVSKYVQDYADGQAKLSKEATKHCVCSIIGGDFTRHYRLERGFYGPSDITTVFHEHVDKVWEFNTAAWLDDFICVTKGAAEDHELELREILSKLQDAGYRGSENKTERFKREVTWLGFYKNQSGVTTVQNGETKQKQSQNCRTQKHLRAEIFSGTKSTFIQIYKQIF